MNIKTMETTENLKTTESEIWLSRRHGEEVVDIIDEYGFEIWPVDIKGIDWCNSKKVLVAKLLEESGEVTLKRMGDFALMVGDLDADDFEYISNDSGFFIKFCWN